MKTGRISGRRSGAAALVEALTRAGAEVVFGYPGGNVIDIFDSVSTAKFRFILGRHEQGCVHMADGYARALGRPGVVLVTSGPGLTNTITGLGAAYMDGVPLVVICGQVPLSDIGTDAFQEADTTGLTRAVSKHNFLVKSADEIPETIAQAFYIATHGKPGPVVIDVPRDCQRALTAAKYPERISLRAYHPEHAASPHEISRLAKLINAAKRPLIYAGGGVIAAEAAADLAQLAHKAQIPVTTTMMGLGAFDENDALSLGMSGLHGTSAANRAIAEADVILALGVRFNDRASCVFSEARKHAKIVQVDCDPSSINKNITVSLGIVADIKDLLTTVDSRIASARHDEWIGRLANLKKQVVKSRSSSQQILMEAIAAAGGKNLVVATDVGQHQLWAARYFRHTEPRRFITSGGMGAMGFGIPAAIGAAMARPDCRIVAIVGDGGAQMTFEEIIVAVEHKLPVVFVVLVNHSLGLVKQMQRREFNGRTFAVDLASPNYVMLARAYGIRAWRIQGVIGAANAAAIVRKALRGRGPALIEVAIDSEAEA